MGGLAAIIGVVGEVQQEGDVVCQAVGQKMEFVARFAEEKFQHLPWEVEERHCSAGFPEIGSNSVGSCFFSTPKLNY